MSAEEHLSDRQFFHGTNVSLSPGEEIRPGRKANFRDEPEQYAYFTPHEFQAHGYARAVSQLYGGAPKVYRVHPTAAHEEDPSAWDLGEAESYRSRSPLRVVSEIPYSQELGNREPKEHEFAKMPPKHLRW